MDRGSVVIELEKPWRDPEGYRRGRLLEAKYEAQARHPNLVPYGGKYVDLTGTKKQPLEIF